MFGKSTLEDICYINYSESTPKKEPYLYEHKKPGHYQIRKRINGKFTNFGTYPYDKAIQVRDFLKDNDWNKELLELMQEMGEI